MHLSSPRSAILSAVVFNALVIIALIPWHSAACASGRCRRRRCCGATSRSTGWAAWSRPSSASSSSTWPSPHWGLLTCGASSCPPCGALRPHGDLRPGLPAAGHRRGPGGLPPPGRGSLVEVDGRPRARALVGQAFTRPEHFHPRPSAAARGTTPYRQRCLQPGSHVPELLAAVRSSAGRGLPRRERTRGRRPTGSGRRRDRLCAGPVPGTSRWLTPASRAPRVAVAARGLAEDGCCCRRAHRR